MMPIRSIILVLFGGLVFLLAVRSLRAQRLKERYVLMFLFVATPFIILSMWPDGIVWLERLLGIEKATLMVLILAAFMILIIFELLSIVSVQERKIASLAQVVGLLMEKQSLQGRPAREPDKTDTRASADSSAAEPPSHGA